MRCRRCGVVAHYRLAYILEKTQIGEPVCRACYWPGWYEWGHKLDAQVIQKHLDEGYDLDFLIDSGFVPRRFFDDRCGDVDRHHTICPLACFRRPV